MSDHDDLMRLTHDWNDANDAIRDCLRGHLKGIVDVDEVKGVRPPLPWIVFLAVEKFQADIASLRTKLADLEGPV